MAFKIKQQNVIYSIDLYCCKILQELFMNNDSTVFPWNPGGIGSRSTEDAKTHRLSSILDAG